MQDKVQVNTPEFGDNHEFAIKIDLNTKTVKFKSTRLQIQIRSRLSSFCAHTFIAFPCFTNISLSVLKQKKKEIFTDVSWPTKA